MEVRLGVNTRFAAKRWPRPEDWAPLVRDQLGLTVVQHCLDLVEPPLGTGSIVGPASAVRKAIVAAGLELHSTISGPGRLVGQPAAPSRPGRPQRGPVFYHRAIAFSARIGARATGGHVGAYAVADWSDPARRRKRWSGAPGGAREPRARRSARRARAFLVENRAAAREPSTMAMLRELLDDGAPERVPIRLALDLGHMCVAGTAGEEREPYAWLRSFATVSSVVQVQQSDATTIGTGRSHPSTTSSAGSRRTGCSTRSEKAAPSR